ncbi:putative Hydroxylysine kinase [Hypsibius exemplaris]|uniref:Hydroxylysine kinase n=1 Tax=Hypsibius exemplaris TaxID=2072580 RepID=A0A1W0X0K3_HYPEX|nr:putative Hydroxylysine kinase [Hypsibius exemplaris]
MASTKPVLTEEQIPELVKELYGLTVKSWTKFDGYDDLNLFIKVDPAESTNSNIPSPSSDGYVLKISNGRFTVDPGSIASQNSLMIFLDGRLTGIEVPTPKRSLSGNYWDFVSLPWKAPSQTPTEKFIVRLLTFTPGKMLSSVATEPSTEVLQQIGRLVGRFAKTMENFDVGLVAPPVVKEIWHLQNCEQVNSLLDAVDDSTQLTVFRDVLAEFERHLTTHRHELPQGVIHGDLNEGNIVMEQSAEEENAQYFVKGIIDFSDMHFSCRIFDLVLALAYMMLECCKKGLLDPIEAGAIVFHGYLQENTISPAEMDILKIGMEARITQSLVIGLHTFKQQPGNRYVLNTQKSGWHVLQILRRMSQQKLFEKWNDIMDQL